MLVNVAVWLNSEKTLRTLWVEISMWVEYFTRHKKQLPFVIWRDASVQHFNTPTGLPFLVLHCILSTSPDGSKTMTPEAVAQPVVACVFSDLSPAAQVTTSAMGARTPSRGRMTRASAASPCPA